MRATVLHIPTESPYRRSDWLRSQGGRRRTSPSGGTWRDRASEATYAPQAPLLSPLSFSSLRPYHEFATSRLDPESTRVDRVSTRPDAIRLDSSRLDSTRPAPIRIDSAATSGVHGLRRPRRRYRRRANTSESHTPPPPNPRPSPLRRESSAFFNPRSSPPRFRDFPNPTAEGCAARARNRY